MSAWPAAAPDPFHGLAPPPDEPAPRDAWFAARLALLLDVNADRALAPAARHALVELLLDAIDDAALPPPEQGDLILTARLGVRLGLSPRGARKAVADLEALGLLETRGREVVVLPGAIAEHLRRGTDTPQSSVAAAAAGDDPTRAHAVRLERLRNLALADGLVSTALSAERALGRALGFHVPAKKKPANDDDDILNRPPNEQRGIHFERVTRFLRDFYIGDPAYHDDLLAWVAKVRAAGGGAAPSPFETAAGAASSG